VDSACPGEAESPWGFSRATSAASASLSRSSAATLRSASASEAADGTEAEGASAWGAPVAVFVSATTFETRLDPGSGVVKSRAKAESCGRNFSQLSSSAKRAVSSLEGLWRNRSRRSSSRLQASSDAVDAAFGVGGAKGDCASSPTEFVLGGAPFGSDAPPCGASLRLPKRASACGCNLGHLSSLSKRIAASTEGFARSSVSRPSSCLQVSSNAGGVGSEAAAGAASSTDLVWGAAPFGVETGFDLEGLLRSSRNVCNCNDNCGHRISLRKLSPSSNEGLALSRARLSLSCLQISSCGWGSREAETLVVKHVVKHYVEIRRDRSRQQQRSRYRKLGKHVHTIVPASATPAKRARRVNKFARRRLHWPAPGSADTEIGCF
jgi:hypothetical protein